uniref:Immunoglobulin subtype domain-containing protein n=1 Tax=Sinocyclocheilus grahami TaxID=75366 RepID=A0A672ND79_SINGR
NAVDDIIIMINVFSSDEVSVKTGEELKLDVLLSNADKVQHQSRRSTEWMKDWSRTDGVQRERITISDGNLIISNFTPRDAGTYRVLDPDGEILITVTVTGEKINRYVENKVHTVIYWIMSAGLLVYAALLVSTLVTLTIQKHTDF